MKKLFFFLTICFSLEATSKGLADFNPNLAKQLVENQGALLLDVRSEQEFSRGSLEKAINVPHFQIESHIKEILKRQKGDRKKPIVVFCAVGGRAAKAKSKLQSLGFENVSNLGGLKDWPK